MILKISKKHFAFSQPGRLCWLSLEVIVVIILLIENDCVLNTLLNLRRSRLFIFEVRTLENPGLRIIKL